MTNSVCDVGYDVTSSVTPQVSTQTVVLSDPQTGS